MNDQRMVDVGLLEEALAAQERSLSWLSSYKGEGTLGENGPYMQMRRSIDKLRAIIDGPGVEPAGMVILKGFKFNGEPLYEVMDSPELRKQEGIDKCGVRFYLAAPSAPVQAVPDWQPIETAPRDVEVFIGRFIDGDFQFGKSTRFYCDGNEMEGEFFHGYVWSVDDVSESIAEEPTHWMPLPQPPKEIGE